jgi:hypothetical protein
LSRICGEPGGAQARPFREKPQRTFLAIRHFSECGREVSVRNDSRKLFDRLMERLLRSAIYQSQRPFAGTASVGE